MRRTPLRPIPALPLLAAISFAAALPSGCPAEKSADPAEAEEDKERSPAELSAIAAARQFLGFLSRGEWSRAQSLFDDTMKREMPQGTLATTWKKVTRESGAFQDVKRTRVEAEGQYRTVLLTVSFAAAEGDVKVVVDPDNKIAGLWFHETREKAGAKKGGDLPPLAPDEDLPEGLAGRTLMTGDDEWPLPGVVVLPPGKGPFPGLVLVHGSGPHDRDEAIGPNKPFKDLAYGLAERGVAVLRYDKRTKVHSRTMAQKQDVTVQDETVDDAVAAVADLAALEEVEDDKVFVLGHSLGGYLLPRIGEASEQAAGFIGLAAASRPLWDSVDEQLDYLGTLEGQGPPTEQLKAMREDIEKIRALKKGDDFEGTLLSVPASYWLDLKGYDPVAEAKEIDKPWLFLQGGRDYQVTEADFARWREELGGQDGVMYKLHPSLGHLFLVGEGLGGEGKTTPADYGKAGKVSPVVLDDIAAFIKRHSR